MLTTKIPGTLKKKLRLRGRAVIIPVLLLCILFYGCSQKVTDVPLPPDLPESFNHSGEDTIPVRWWIVFEDNHLNVLVDSALTSNFDLKSSWQNLLAARYIADRERSGLFPRVEASLQGGIDYPQPDYVGGESFRFGLMTEYEVDLWGRIRSSIEAEEYRARAVLSGYRATALFLSAQIVNTWFSLAEATSQRELIDDQIKLNGQMLQLLKARLGSGLIRSADVLRQQQLLESNNEQLIQVNTEIELLKNELNVLLGRLPDTVFSELPDSLPVLPPLPETGVPANLVMRRPDVQEAYNRLLAADRDLATAVSSKYPRFSVVANTSVRANNLNQLFEDWAYSLAGNLLAPLFRGGALQAEANRAEAVKNQLLNEYTQTVLLALKETEDALVREINQQEKLNSIKNQLTLAEKAYRQLRLEYFNGMANYIDVLTALSQQQQLQRNLINETHNMLTARTALYRALAGGFETPAENMSN